jgi:hypothetical protein
MNEHRKKVGIALGFLLIGLITGAAIVYAFTPSFTTYISGGSMASTTGFIIFPDQSYYLARNGLTGRVTIDTNFTNLFDFCQDNLPVQGGTIHLKTGYFEGHILIDRDGVTLEGETVYEDIPLEIPDNSPTVLYGSVIKVTQAGVDGIHISGQRYGIVIRDLGIWFNVSSTGNGITTDMGQTYTVTHATIQNVKILNHDKSHYAIQLSNFLHCKVEQVMAWGGSLMNLYGNMPNFQSGNSFFQSVYGYIKYDFGTINYNNGPYPIFIHRNDSQNSNFINLMEFTRVQINNPNHQSDDDTYYTCTLWGLRYSTFRNLDLESVEANTIQMGSCLDVTFITAYTWAMAPANAYVNIASDNSHIHFIDSYLNHVLDSNYTDTYTACNIVGTIDGNSTANFEDLPGNSGYGEIIPDEGDVTITARFIGLNYMVLITPLIVADLDGNASLRISSMLSAPVNQFTVKTMNAYAMGATLDFYWKVFSKMTP